MISTVTELHVRDAEASDVLRLPERLRTGGLMLATADCVAAVIALVVSVVISGTGATAFLTLAATLIIAGAAGRYRGTFALRPADEWYAAGGMAVLGASAGIVLAAMLGFDLFAAIGSTIVWVPVAALFAGRLQRIRRGGTRYEGVLERVRESSLGTLWRAQQSLLRCLDVLFVLVISVIAIPVSAVIALLVWRDSGRPVFFTQERVTRDDKSFVMWKFRTMRSGAGSDWVVPGDDRITPFGRFLRKTSLDELPQLWNVLCGDMSLVGPRPEMREYADRFSHQMDAYSQRHIVRPGLTGWAQVNLPRNLQPEDAPSVLRADLFYVQNAGVHLYMLCLVKTACEIFAQKAV